MEPTGPFTAQLFEIRSTLRDALRASEALEMKLIGPRPADPTNTPKPTDTVASVLGEINNLSVRLAKMLGHYHDIIGDFNVAESAPSQRGYAS